MLPWNHPSRRRPGYGRLAPKATRASSLVDERAPLVHLRRRHLRVLAYATLDASLGGAVRVTSGAQPVHLERAHVAGPPRLGLRAYLASSRGCARRGALAQSPAVSARAWRTLAALPGVGSRDGCFGGDRRGVRPPACAGGILVRPHRAPPRPAEGPRPRARKGIRRRDACRCRRSCDAPGTGG